MITIKKHYHFYAAHRNEMIQGKCRNLHGHTYHLTVVLMMNEPGVSGITMLFEDIDKRIEPLVRLFDHTTMLHDKDPLYDWFAELNEKIEKGFETSMLVLPFVTSVENLAKHFFEQIRALGLTVTAIELQETTSSVAIYTKY